MNTQFHKASLIGVIPLLFVGATWAPQLFGADANQSIARLVRQQ